MRKEKRAVFSLLSCLVSSCLVSPGPVLWFVFWFASYRLVLSGLVWSCLVLSGLLSCLGVMPCVLSCTRAFVTQSLQGLQTGTVQRFFRFQAPVYSVCVPHWHGRFVVQKKSAIRYHVHGCLLRAELKPIFIVLLQKFGCFVCVKPRCLRFCQHRIDIKIPSREQPGGHFSSRHLLRDATRVAWLFPFDPYLPYVFSEMKQKNLLLFALQC